jgi:threonine dehydratase
MVKIPGRTEIQQAHERIKPFIHVTPVLTSLSINRIAGGELYFKCENFQKTGSFKIRGAMNAVLSLNKENSAKGIITHSSGNFAQALAYGAKCAGIKASIVMPENVNPVKRDAVLGYGAEIIYSGNNPEDRERMCDEVINKTGAVFIHPSNDINVISGHASCAIELIDETPALNCVIAPVGGGGLLSGISIGFKHFSPDTKIYAGEPKNADDAFQSLKEGKIIPQTNPNTIADGLRTSLGSVTFPLMQKLVTEILPVTEEEIISAMRMIWERMKIIAEPSGSVALAAVLKSKDIFKNKKTGIIISGGNVDLNNIAISLRTE